MGATNILILQSGIVIISYVLIRIIFSKIVDRTMRTKLVQKQRGKIIKKASNIALFLTCSILLLLIWGIDQSELVVFVGTVLTVIGIALFAQWSILSNITSSVLIFFNHNVRLEDTIVIMDKDYEIEGRVSDIGLFFVILKTSEGEEITIPNNVFIQKMIKKKIKEGNKNIIPKEDS